MARSGSLSASSRTLRVDPATVSRRIASFEDAVGSRLFDRHPDGYRLTATGLKLLDHAIRVEDDLLGLSKAVATEDRVVAGQVAVTASEAVTLSFLIPALPRLRNRHPGIRLDILSSNQVFSLARREADIALRSVRPDGGDLLARRIATMAFGLYASTGYLDRLGRPRCPDDLGGHTFVDWLEDYPRAETTVWYRRVTPHPAVARMTGSQERLEAGLAGLGIVCLPHILVQRQGVGTGTSVPGRPAHGDLAARTSRHRQDAACPGRHGLHRGGRLGVVRRLRGLRVTAPGGGGANPVRWRCRRSG